LRLTVPSLRERIDDLPALADALIAKHSRRHGLAQPDDALRGHFIERARAYAWPGNVRELENMVERLMAAACEADPLARQALLAMLFPEFDAAPAAVPTQAPASLRAARRALTVQHARAALASAGGNTTLAAQQLGVGRTTLWRLLKTAD
jgi:transcriptional regulator, propionate catabolism operon regulatory protein